MTTSITPEQIVQQQLDAYNAHDLDAWLTTYAPDARQFEHPATLLASGHAEIRARGATISRTSSSCKADQPHRVDWPGD